MNTIIGVSGNLAHFVNAANGRLTPKLTLHIVSEVPHFTVDDDGHVNDNTSKTLTHSFEAYPEVVRSIALFLTDLVIKGEEERASITGQAPVSDWPLTPMSLALTVSDRQNLGWDDKSLLTHMGGYIASRCQPEDFHAYMERVAQEEVNGSEALGVPDFKTDEA